VATLEEAKAQFPCSENNKGDLPLKDWLRKLRRENDPREPIVKATFTSARKAAKAWRGLTTQR
jgi:hypothetical protein